MLETCFVMMPFGEHFDDMYKSVLVPAIEAAGYKPVRGDDAYSIRPVIDDIFHEIRSAAVLVADVSGKNPNVNYELGVAHGLNKSVLIIAQDIEDIPFDYRHLRSIVYNQHDDSWAGELSNKITNTLQAQQKVLLGESMKDGRKMALVGKWGGKLNQQVDDGSVSIDTEMEMAHTPSGEIKGTWLLLGKPLIGSNILFNISCAARYDRYLKLDFVSADQMVMTFGTLMARVSANARSIDGQYVGYGSVSDKLVTGSVNLSKIDVTESSPE